MKNTIGPWQFSVVLKLLGAFIFLRPSPGYAVTRVDLLGHSVSQMPFFIQAQAFRADEKIDLGINGLRYAGLSDSCDIYALRGDTILKNGDRYADFAFQAPMNVPIKDAATESNRWTVTSLFASALKAGSTDVAISAALDCDRDGVVSDGDFIQSSPVRIYGNLAAPGTHAFTQLEISADHSWRQQLLYYPTDLVEAAPLVVLVHGGGHEYVWYRYLQEHLASHGYASLSIDSHAMGGIQEVANEAVANLDHFLANLSNHPELTPKAQIDPHRLVFLGHSRGGEGITVADHALRQHLLRPERFKADDIRALFALSPTSFLPGTVANPESVDLFMIVGAADGDVSQEPKPHASSFTLFERASGNRYLNYVYGLGHEMMDCCGHDESVGPNRLTKSQAQDLVKSYVLAMLESEFGADATALDFFRRPAQTFRPIGAPSAPILNEYRELATSFVIDDFESGSSLTRASSGAIVESDLADARIAVMQDLDQSLAYSKDQPMNGFVRAQNPGDSASGLALDWQKESSYTYNIRPEHRNFGAAKALTIRVAQRPRDPLDATPSAARTFAVELEDWNGRRSRISSSAVGELLAPYARDGDGDGVGWTAGFQTFTFAIDDFSQMFYSHSAVFDPENVRKVRLIFGGTDLSPAGAVTIDDVSLQGIKWSLFRK